jgi:hypothetical protein
LPAEAASLFPSRVSRGGGSGPYDTEAQARGVLGEGNRRLLRSALDAAGVDLGAYDHAIVDWLAGYEPATVAVIASWISRAGSRRAPAEPERFGVLGARMVAELHRRAARQGGP